MNTTSQKPHTTPKELGARGGINRYVKRRRTDMSRESGSDTTSLGLGSRGVLQLDDGRGEEEEGGEATPPVGEAQDAHALRSTVHRRSSDGVRRRRRRRGGGRRQRARASLFILTLYPNEGDEGSWHEEDMGPKQAWRARARWCVWQWEVGNEENRLHVQYALGTRGQYSPLAVKGWFGDLNAHVECAKGTAQQCADYCSKDDTRADTADLPDAWARRHPHAGAGPHRFGRTPSTRRGIRTDLQAAFKFAREHHRGVAGLRREHQRAFAESFPGVWARYPEFARRVGALYDQPRRVEQLGRRSCTYIYGPTRSGKSWLAYQAVWDKEFYYKPHGQWFDGYTGQEVIVIEEFTDHAMSIEQLMLLTDPTMLPCLQQYKGGTTNYHAHHVILTSNIHPLDLYPRANPANKAALLERLKDSNDNIIFCKARDDHVFLNINQRN